MVSVKSTSLFTFLSLGCDYLYLHTMRLEWQSSSFAFVNTYLPIYLSEQA